MPLCVLPCQLAHEHTLICAQSMHDVAMLPLPDVVAFNSFVHTAVCNPFCKHMLRLVNWPTQRTVKRHLVAVIVTVKDQSSQRLFSCVFWCRNLLHNLLQGLVYADALQHLDGHLQCDLLQCSFDKNNNKQLAFETVICMHCNVSCSTKFTQYLFMVNTAEHD